MLANDDGCFHLSLNLIFLANKSLLDNITQMMQCKTFTTLLNSKLIYGIVHSYITIDK